MFRNTDSKLEFAMTGYRRRIVTDQNALREKAIIFENELDDRVIELVKCLYLAHATQKFPDAKIEAVYFLIADGKYILQFMGDTPISAEFDRSMYDAVTKQFADRLTEETNEEATIDIGWAQAAF